MSSQGWPCADVACRSNCTGLRYITVSLPSKHDEHHILETMMKSSTYRARATCSSSLLPPGRKPCRVRAATSSVQAASSAPKTTLQLAGLWGPPMGSPSAWTQTESPTETAFWARAMSKPWLSSSQFEEDGAKRVAPPLLDEEGRPSRALADGHPRVATVCGPGDEGSQAATDPARGDLLIHLGRVSNDHGRAGHVGIAPGTEDCARGLPPCSWPAVSGQAGESRNFATYAARPPPEGGDIMPPTPSGNERLDTPGQPAVILDRRVRAPADHLAEAAVSWLLASASLQVCEAFNFQVHVHVIEAEPGPAVGRGHVREPSREQRPVQMVV